MNEIIDLCMKIEPFLRAAGFHCGFTGSRLYGNVKKNDIDIVIYGHNTSAGRQAAYENADSLCKVLAPVIAVRVQSEHEYSDILRGKWNNITVDFILL